MSIHLISFTLSLLLAAQALPAAGDYGALEHLGPAWVSSARADKLTPAEVRFVAELADAWNVSNRQNQFDPYIRKLAAFHAATAADAGTTRPQLHGAACWHSRKVAAIKGAASAPPSFLWAWINPKNAERCPA